MAENNKTVSARDAILAVLAKAKQVLETSDLVKSEYKTENSPKPGVKYGKIETAQKATERDYKEYEVKSGGSKDSTGPRVAKQISPSGNPKEEAEGNNKPDGMEPHYEFKDKVAGELAKEKKALGKAENPDKEQDAALGEKVENDVEEHFKENAGAERQEGHSMANPEDKTDKATTIPRLILSAKLSKFMEFRHAKKKAQESAAAVGSPAASAPAPRSTQDSQPDTKKI